MMLFLPLLFLSPARGEEVKPVAVTVADCFKGATVEKWKGRRITLRYDLTKPGPLDDFVPVNPFLAPPRGGFTMADGALLGRGVGALCHKGVFEADVDVKVAEFRLLINCLYSEDLLTRTLAIETLERVTGKTLGYDPRASAQSRKDAIRDWFRWFGQNRDRLK
jgi:hypothetical protein